MNYSVATLPNGLRVITTPMPTMYSVSALVFLGVGSRFEDDAVAGSSHLLEHMLFKGTARRPTAQILSETIESTGGSLDASTGKEETILSARVAGADADLALDLLADMLLNSLFAAPEVDKEKGVIVEELSMIADSPAEWVHTLLDGIIWPGHPLGRDIGGTRESVLGLTRADLVRFRDSHYAPATTVISVAGNLNVQATLATVERLFSSWAPRAAPQALAAPPIAAAPRIHVEERDTEQLNLCVSTGGVDHHDPDRFAFDLLGSILGGGVSSRLFLELRERRGLVYDIHTSGQRLSDTGALVTYAGVDPRNVQVLVKEVVGQLDRLRREPVGHDELARFKSSYKGHILLGLEDTYSVASWCGGQQLLRRSIQSPEEVIAAVEEVQVADLQRVARDLFTDQSLRLAAIGPLDDADAAALEEELRLAPL